MNLYKTKYPTMWVELKGVTVDVLPPQKKYISAGTSIDDYKQFCVDIINNNVQKIKFTVRDFTQGDALALIQSFWLYVKTLHEMPELKIPYCYEKADEIKYNIETFAEKLVSEYSKLSFFEIEEMNIVDFWLALRNAVIYNRCQSEDGRKYLEKCWCSEQKTADRDGLIRRFGSGE